MIDFWIDEATSCAQQVWNLTLEAMKDARR